MDEFGRNTRPSRTRIFFYLDPKGSVIDDSGGEVIIDEKWHGGHIPELRLIDIDVIDHAIDHMTKEEAFQDRSWYEVKKREVAAKGRKLLRNKETDVMTNCHCETILLLSSQSLTTTLRSEVIALKAHVGVASS